MHRLDNVWFMGVGVQSVQVKEHSDPFVCGVAWRFWTCVRSVMLCLAVGRVPAWASIEAGVNEIHQSVLKQMLCRHHQLSKVCWQMISRGRQLH